MPEPGAAVRVTPVVAASTCTPMTGAAGADPAGLFVDLIGRRA
jgi:hypothetical protein